MNKLKQWPLFPFFLSIFPILSLWASNSASITPWTTYRFIFLTIVAQAIIYLLFRFIYKNRAKAAILATITSLIFSSYGHIYAYIEDRLIFGLNIGRHRYLILFTVLLILLVAWWLAKTKTRLEAIIPAANLIAVIVLMYPLVSILTYQVQSANSRESESASIENETGYLSNLPILSPSIDGYKPDIYYIILDSYTREDILNECFSFDNSEFLNKLEDLGFYIADQSRSNYTITDLSLATSLNINYPTQMGKSAADAADMTILTTWIQNSVVETALKKSGYKVVAFDSGYYSTDWTDAEYYFSTDQGINKYLGGINPFESMVLQTSGGIFIYEIRDVLPGSFKMILDSAYIKHRNRILKTLDELGNIPKIDQPTFTFAHILAPHDPFVFGPQGEFVQRKTPFTLNDDPEMTSGFKYKRGYVDQVEYLNTRIIEVVSSILASSSEQPIIIIQGDHGAPRWITSETGRSDILNAFYLPGGPGELYATISPVNSFRVIFNSYFGTNLPLLPDEFFFTTHNTIDQLIQLAGDDHICHPN